MIESYLEDGRQTNLEVFWKIYHGSMSRMGKYESLVREIYQRLGE